MDNLHRKLAPISSAAWDQIDGEALRTFITRIAGRRVVDVPEPGGSELSAVNLGHSEEIASPVPGVNTRQRQVQPLIERGALITVTRAAVADVERGAQDSDWQPVKDAVEALALAEIVFAGSEAAGVTGIITQQLERMDQLSGGNGRPAGRRGKSADDASCGRRARTICAASAGGAVHCRVRDRRSWLPRV